MINYYDLIGVSMDAPEEELREKIVSGINKWRKRVNAPNPERQREASENLERLQEAQNILLNKEKREDYNRKLQAQANQQEDSGQAQVEQDEEPNRTEELEKRYNFHFDEKDYSNAIIVARELVSIDPKNAFFWAKLAFAHTNWREYADARYEINQAISLLPNHAQFYYAAHNIYLSSTDINQNEKFDKLREYIDKALNIEPHNPVYRSASASLYYDEGYYQNVIDILEGLREEGELSKHDAETLTLAYVAKVENECTIRVNYNDGSHRYFFTDPNLINRAKELMQKTLDFAKTNEARDSVNRINTAVNEALKNEYNLKFLIPLIIGAMWFLGALSGFSLISMIISGVIAYFSWRKFREPVYIKNQRYIKSLNKN